MPLLTIKLDIKMIVPGSKLLPILSTIIVSKIMLILNSMKHEMKQAA